MWFLTPPRVADYSIQFNESTRDDGSAGVAVQAARIYFSVQRALRGDRRFLGLLTRRCRIAYSHQGFNISEGESPERVDGAYVTANFLRVLGLTPTLGRGFVADDDVAGATPVVVLSDGLWRGHFDSDSSAVGQTIRIDAVPHTVIGIMPPEFRVFHPGPEDLWIPGLTNLPPATDTATAFRWHWLRTVAMLHRDVSVEQAQLEMNEIAAQLGEEHPRSNDGWGVHLVPMHEQVVGDTRTAVLLLFGAVGFVLLIGCANVSNLMLARATARKTEMSLRLALGATRARAIQFHIADIYLEKFLWIQA